MNTIPVQFKRLRETAQIPVYSSAIAAGADIYACIIEPIKIHPGEIVKIPTGFSTEYDDSVVALILPRSGVATKRGLVIANTMPVIDADYRGEWMVPIYNRSDKIQEITPNERFAQVLFMPVYRACFSEVDELSDTERGEGGFGSTGIK